MLRYPRCVRGRGQREVAAADAEEGRLVVREDAAYIILQPLTIKYCQDDSCMLRVSLVAAVCYTVLNTRCHTHLAMAKPRTTSQEARPPPAKKSEIEFRNGSGTSFRHPNAYPKTTTHMYSQSRAEV